MGAAIFMESDNIMKEGVMSGIGKINLHGSIFINNTASSMGAAIFSTKSIFAMSDCHFDVNIATDTGRAMV